MRIASSIILENKNKIFNLKNQGSAFISINFYFLTNLGWV